MSQLAANAAYWPGAWPAEDAGPERLQAPRGEAGPSLADGESLLTLAVRQAPGAQMAVRRGPDEVFLLRSLFGRRVLRDPARTLVERIDPLTLEPTACSPELPAGPWWAGGLAVMADGNITVVSGRWAHRLDGDDLDVIASRELPAPRPYNSFVALADGTVITKDFDQELSAPCRVHALDGRTLADRCEPIDLGEPVIARLSADGGSVFAVGRDRVHRLDWDGASLHRVDNWSPRYRTRDGQGHGWDPVIAGGRIWFLDQGRHRFRLSMRGSGLDRGHVSLHAIDLSDQSNHFELAICGRSHGSITNPPLIDPSRGIAVGYDSAAGRVTAFGIPDDPADRPEPIWQAKHHTAPHLLRFDDTGELVLFDHRAPWPLGTRAGSTLLAAGLSDLMRRSGERRPGLEARLATRLAGEDVVIVDIGTGEEKGRTTMPVMGQSVAFPTAGGNRDLITANFTGVQRVGVAP